MFDSIICHYTVHNAFNLSSHVPLQIEVYMQTEKVKISENIRKPGINWNSVTDAHINLYQRKMDQILRKIQVNSEALKCKNVNCENGDHKII